MSVVDPEWMKHRRRRVVVLTSTADYIGWKILSDDIGSSYKAADALGLCPRTVRAGIAKACYRINNDEVILKIYEAAKKEYLCSNSVTV